MRNQIKKMAGSILTAVVLVAGLTTGVTAYAASTDTGAAGALTELEYTLEEMLVYAIEDEYLAQAEYDVIMETYGAQKPFSSIIKAEATHINLLIPLFEKYGTEIPQKDWERLVPVPVSLQEAYETGVEAEEKNIAMYDSFLKENLPDDVRDVFEKLMNASEKHLAAFEKQVDGNAGSNGIVNGNRSNGGKVSTSGGGNGKGKSI